MLRAQSYGGEDDYLAHIKYLMPFFKDCRYLKIDNKPVFVIYDINSIPEYDLMIKVWEKELRQEGFNGINIVAMKCRPNVKTFELQGYKDVYAVMPFEPLNVRSNAANGNKFYILEDVCELYFIDAWINFWVLLNQKHLVMFGQIIKC